jgi:hypothetical protein
MSKQDRQGVRTPADLESKYQFGKRFAEILGIANDARESVDYVESTLRSEIKEQITSITRDTESIIMSALESYVEKTEYEELRKTMESEFAVMADKITMEFEVASEQITEVDGNLQTVVDELQKHFEFSVDGLVIKAGANSMNLVIDNDLIKFVRNNQLFGWWDGVDFHTGNIVVEVSERAQFGNFAFVPRSNGSLDFLKVDDYIMVAITKHPQNKTVTATYQSATFSVTAAGSGITYQWQQSTDGTTWKEYNSKASSFTTMYTSTTGVKKIYYRCVVTDGRGNTAISNVATFTLNA